MRTLTEITASLIESYNNGTPPNFVDIRDMEILSKGTQEKPKNQYQLNLEQINN